MDAATVAQLITFAGVVAGFAYQAWQRARDQRFQFEREARQRQWDIEDRLAIAATLAHHTTLTAAALDVKATDTALTLQNMIGENTKISTEAFHEANTVNQKLAKLGLQRNRELARLKGVGPVVPPAADPTHGPGGTR